MADNAATSQEDDLSLPRAAVNKMIKEMIPMIRVSNDARELLLSCCTEFIHLIASEANDICNQQTKKTISPEHVIAALESLGFHDYVEDVESVYQQFKTQAQSRKKSLKLKNQGVSEEELLRQQQALINQARAAQAQEEWLHMQQQGIVTQPQQQIINTPAIQETLATASHTMVSPSQPSSPSVSSPNTMPSVLSTITPSLLPDIKPPVLPTANANHQKQPQNIINRITGNTQFEPANTNIISNTNIKIEAKSTPLDNCSSSVIVSNNFQATEKT